MRVGCVCLLAVVALSSWEVQATIPDNDASSLAGDVKDLIEMVPCDQLAALFFEYLSADSQVTRMLHYLTGPSFKANLVLFETSPTFHEAYDSLMPLGVDIYQWTNELNRLLDIAIVRPAPASRIAQAGRRRRAPGDGVLGLVKDALAIIPITDIKEVYNFKLDTKPQFEKLMDRLLTVELRDQIYSLMGSPQFEDVALHLNGMGVPFNKIIDLVEEEVVKFFDLESKEEEGDEMEMEE